MRQAFAETGMSSKGTNYGTKMVQVKTNWISNIARILTRTLYSRKFYAIATVVREQKRRTVHMVFFKTVRECRRNKQKIRKFCLEEAPAAIREQSPSTPSVSTIPRDDNEHSVLISLAKVNHRQQQRTPHSPRPTPPPHAPRARPKHNRGLQSAEEFPSRRTPNQQTNGPKHQIN